MLELFTNQLSASKSLSVEEISVAVEHLVDATVVPAVKADFLIALARKGETAQEIAAFAAALRTKSVQPPIDPAWRAAHEILDVCGTGGDRLNTFNISTTVALICAAAGVPVAKHGNRAITSQAGSADVLEALGVRVDLSPEAAAASLRERNFAFFFAPSYHPSFRHIAPARKICAERGQRTIFNFLGPLLNPARPSAQLIGVPRPQLCEPLARVLQSLGVRRGMVVCGKVVVPRPAEVFPDAAVQQIRVVHFGDGRLQVLSTSAALALAKETSAALVEIKPAADPPVYGLVDKADLNQTPAHDPANEYWLDELSSLGVNTVAEFHQERGFSISNLEVDEFPVQLASLVNLLGGDRHANARIVRNILEGKDRGPKRDAVLINAAAALFIAGKCRTLMAGWELAATVIEGGHAAQKLEQLRAD